MKKLLLTSLFALGFSVSAHAGVKEVYKTGSSAPNGSPIYKVKCTSGSSSTAYKANDGFWKDGGGSNYGSSYKGLGINSFASKKCG